MKLKAWVVVFGCVLLAGCGGIQSRADQGDANAQFELGVMYDLGLGMSQDDGQAVVWYRKAADQGVPAAQYRLGLMYANGRGVPQDAEHAAAWTRKAADQGVPEAQ